MSGIFKDASSCPKPDLGVLARATLIGFSVLLVSLIVFVRNADALYQRNSVFLPIERPLWNTLCLMVFGSMNTLIVTFFGIPAAALFSLKRANKGFRPKSFLMRSLFIGFALFVFAVIMFLLNGDKIYQLSTMIYPHMPRSDFNLVSLASFGLMKILLLVCYAIPCLAVACPCLSFSCLSCASSEEAFRVVPTVED